MLTKQSATVVKKFRNTNNYGSNSRDQNNYKRKKFDKSSGREIRSFEYRECEGYGHYQVECPHFSRRQKKSVGSTLSDEKSDDNEEEYNKAFISILCKDDFVSWVEDSILNKENIMSYDQL